VPLVESLSIEPIRTGRRRLILAALDHVNLSVTWIGIRFDA
jgi:hypothetical protein